jgi:hypothetical protein
MPKTKRWQMHVTDVLTHLRTMGDNSQDAALLDNPYGLGDDPTPEEIVAFLTSAAGLDTGDFMGKGWQVPSVAVWRELLRVLKPGAHMFCFGGTRTFDLVSLGARLAGFRFLDTTAWMYATGMHHGHNITDALADVDPETAAAWAGHNTRQKPAWEPAMLFVKPHEGTIAENVRRWGVGGINVDGCRIGAASYTQEQWTQKNASRTTGATYGAHRPSDGPVPSGRWPSNVVLDEAMAEALNEQAGERRNGGQNATSARASHSVAHNGYGPGAPTSYAGDAGSASRFYYVAKASRRERDAGCHGKVPAHGNVFNDHVCVKPIGLTTYLAKMLLPPPHPDGSPRKIVVPYSGSGSEIIGAALAGWEEVVGIEREPEFVAIARARCEHWIDKGLTAKDAPAKGKGSAASFNGKTKQCNVCGNRTAEAGAGGRWPSCEHDDWTWVPRLSASKPEPPQLDLFGA